LGINFAYLRLHVLALIILLILPAAAFALDEEGANVTDIQISGNKKVETETILSKVSTKVGDTFSPSRIRDDISSIYKMGFFEDVQVEAEGYSGGLRLTFNVVERPIIKSFVFEGNKKLDNAKLKEKINLTAYSVYNPALVAENVEKLKLVYQGEGYYNAQVQPIIKEISKNEVKVIFSIVEGAKVRISNIEFTGNEHMSARQIRKAMATKKFIWGWSWIMSTGAYRIGEFNNDMERIKSLYYNEGYIQISVGEPQLALNEDKDRLTITIPIHEGEQFSYKSISLAGNSVIPTEDLMKQVQSKEGEIMNRDLLKADVIRMTDLYGTKGYAFASISPVIEPDIEKKTVNVKLEVAEGDKIFVSRINVTGNTKTRDKVIRRELKYAEGDIYDTSSMKKSYDRLKNLDFFEDVEIVPNRKEGSNIVDLDVKVKEKSTGSFSIGGGYSTVDSLVALGEVTQNNFLGLGQTLSFRGEFGKRKQNFMLSFVEPWLLNRPVSLSVDLFKEERTYTGFSKRSTGGNMSLGKRFWEYYGSSVSYSYAKEKYFDVLAEMKPYTSDNDTTSKVGVSAYRDTRDNYNDPRRGSRNSVYLEYAPRFIGGDNNFYKAIADTIWYFPFYWDTCFSAHGRLGYAKGQSGSNLAAAERFYVGGISTIRGFTWGHVGPKGTNGQPIGGNKEIVMNGEYTFPLLASLKLRGVAFLDAGNAYGENDGFTVTKLRYSIGAGARWTSPMGLIRLEYGHIFSKREGEKSGKWEFSLGNMF